MNDGILLAQLQEQKQERWKAWLELTASDEKETSNILNERFINTYRPKVGD